MVTSTNFWVAGYYFRPSTLLHLLPFQRPQEMPVFAQTIIILVCWTPWISLVRALELQFCFHTILPSLVSWYVLAYKKHNHARSKNNVNFKSTAGQRVITSTHTVLKSCLTKITPSSASSRRPSPSNKENPLWIVMRDWNSQPFTILSWEYATTFLLHNLKFYITDEVQVIRAKYSICFKPF